MKRKKTGQPFNEMKKRFENKREGTPFNEMKRIVKKQQRRKKDDETMQYNYQNELTTEGTIRCKVEMFLTGSLDSILSPSPSMKIQVMGGKFA